MAKGEQRETLEIKQKMPFLAGKLAFFYESKQKERNKKKGDK